MHVNITYCSDINGFLNRGRKYINIEQFESRHYKIQKEIIQESKITKENNFIRINM